MCTGHHVFCALYVGLCQVLARLPHAKVSSNFDALCWLQVEQLDRMVSVVDSLLLWLHFFTHVGCLIVITVAVGITFELFPICFD